MRWLALAWLGCATLLVPAGARALDADALRRCAQIAEDAARLACFDALAATAHAASGLAGAASQPAPQQAPGLAAPQPQASNADGASLKAGSQPPASKTAGAGQRTASQPVSLLADAPGEAPARAAKLPALPADALQQAAGNAPVSSARGEALFGLPLERTAPKTPEAIRSELLELVRDGRGRATLRLANGQRWRLQERDMIVLRPNEARSVRIRKGLLGAFYLQLNGRGRGYRARRIE